MKRDMDLVRAILIAVEREPAGFAPPNLEIEGYSKDQIAYHNYLLIDAKLADGATTTHLGSTGPEAIISTLTWAGHEFLDAARDETLWNQAKAKIRAAGSATVPIWTALLTQLISRKLGL